MFIINIRINLRKHSLTGCKHMACVIGSILIGSKILMIHLHGSVWSDDSIIQYIDGTIATFSNQCYRHTINDFVSGHRGNLATAIDTM